MKRTTTLLAMLLVIGISTSGLAQGGGVELVFKGRAPVNGMPVTVLPLDGGAPVSGGLTSADGTLTLDEAIGGLGPGKPVKVTVRDCPGRSREVFIGAVPAKKEDCDDTVIGFLWGGGRHELTLDGGRHTTRNVAVGTGIAAGILIGATQIGGGQPAATAPTVAMPGSSNTNTGGSTTPATPAAPTCVNQSGTTTATLMQDACGGFRGFSANVQHLCGADNSLMLTFLDQIPRTVSGPRGVLLNLTGSGPFPVPGVSRYEATFNGTQENDIITGQEALRLVATNGQVCLVIWGHVIRFTR